MRIKKARTIGRLVSREGRGSGCVGMVGIDNFAIPEDYDRFPRRLKISRSCRGPARQIHVDRMRFVFVTRARERAVALTTSSNSSRTAYAMESKTFRGSDNSYVYVRNAVARSEANQREPGGRYGLPVLLFLVMIPRHVKSVHHAPTLIARRAAEFEFYNTAKQLLFRRFNQNQLFKLLSSISRKETSRIWVSFWMTETTHLQRLISEA